jgi:hypothetical protein
MANFSNSFMGKGTGIVLQGSGTQAQQGLNEMVLNAEKLRYDVYQKNRSEFLKNANIDPEFVLSDSARKTQMLLIEDFNKKWGKRAQETNYNLSQQDLLDMQTHKNLIISTQQDQLAKYELFKQHRAAVAQNPNRFDADKFNEAQDAYMQTGDYDLVMPPLKPIPPGSYIRGLSQKLEGVNPRQVIAGNQRGIETTPFATMEEAENFVQESLLQNDQAMLGGLEEWSTLPQAEKDSWFAQADENSDKKYSQAEQQNAIMMWMKKRYAPEAMRPTVGGWKNIPQPLATTTKKEKSYEVLKDQIFESVTVKSFLNLSPDETSAKTQPVQKYIDLATGKEETLNRAATFKIVGYSPDKDLIIVNLTADVPVNKKGDPYLPANKQIGLKGSLYNDFIKNKFGVDREELMKQYGGDNRPPLLMKPTTSGVTWLTPKK